MPRIVLVLVLVLPACGASQKPGPEFCESYELNYLTDCQGYCESESGASGDQSVTAECEKKCKTDLSEDDNFNESCSAQAEKLKK